MTRQREERLEQRDRLEREERRGRRALDAGIDAFRDHDFKRYMPLAVLGGLVLIGMYVLSAGATQERSIVRAPPDTKEQRGPVRDIRQARRLSQPAEKRNEPGAQQPARAAEQPANRDALWADMEPQADQETGAEQPRSEATEAAEDELVEAMKRAIADQKGGEK